MLGYTLTFFHPLLHWAYYTSRCHGILWPIAPLSAKIAKPANAALGGRKVGPGTFSCDYEADDFERQLVASLRVT